MGVRLILQCGGCDASETVGPLRLHAPPESLTPEGWVMYDPWTRCTYCPTCWREITQRPSRG